VRLLADSPVEVLDALSQVTLTRTPTLALALALALIRSCTRTLLDALSQAVGRYVGCTSQAGEIREYRDARGKVLAFAHEATKGRVMRGQWFYSTDQAAKNYVWFH